MLAIEAKMHHRMPCRPVPAVVDRQTLEQRLVALEQLLDGVHQQALAEAARPREEVVASLGDQPLDVGGLVDVVAVLRPDLVEGLEADREFALDHGKLFAPTDCNANRVA